MFLSTIVARRTASAGRRAAASAAGAVFFLAAAAATLGAIAPIAVPPAATAAATAAATPGPDFRFAFIGDRTGSAAPGIWESVVDQIEMFHPEFVVSVGDHIEGYTEDPAELDRQWTGIDGILSRLSVPYYLCPGNHDITTDGMLPVWKARTHREPCYSFDHQGVHFIILDTSRWDTSEQWMRDSGYADWLRADLDQNRNARLTVAVFHKPYWYNTIAEGRPDPLHDLFRENGVDYVFNGHFHNYGSGTYDGIRYTILGSSGGGIDGVDENRGMFYQYAWCAVRGDSLDWQLVRPEAVLPERCVPVSDLKFLDEVATRHIQAVPFSLPDGAQAGPASCTVSIHNVTPDPWTAHLRWEPAPGWSVTPDTASLALSPEVSASAPFEVRRTGPFYPLPRIRLDYPYRGGRVYKYDQPLPARRTQPVFRLVAGASAPKIDGRLDDACWTRAVAATEFGDPNGDACTIEPTAVFFAQDRSNLYVAARCTQTDGPPLARALQRDAAVHRDDCVGFFLCPDPAGKTVYQIYFNAAGTVFDQKITVEGPGQYGGEMAKWNGKYRVATRQTDGAWTVEAAIPFAVLNASAPAPGDQWRVNFRRKEMSRGSSADWQCPLDYDPARLGYLRFGD
jgi:hypothetical protein